MFTGIIEVLGTVEDVEKSGTNLHFWISSPISDELKIDQSLAHDGVCLTVVEAAPGRHRVTAVDETIAKTALGRWAPGRTVNLERALRAGDRLDGHFVQGHVDAVGRCTARAEVDGSWKFSFSFPSRFAPLLVEKGSVCINGVSLTCFDVSATGFSVAIIPYTHEHTTFGALAVGDAVNLEFDILGKYLQRHLAVRSASPTTESVH